MAGIHRCGLLVALTMVVIACCATAGATADDQNAGKFDETKCLHMPLRGAVVVSDDALALVSSQREVALVKLSGPCLRGRSPQITMQLTGFSERLCKKRDVEQIINDRLTSYIRTGPYARDFTGMNVGGQCSVVDFQFVGHLDDEGMIVGVDGKRLGRVSEDTGSASASVDPANPRSDQ